MISMIAAVSPNGVMGLSKENKLPWDYKADMKFFRTMTANSSIIMGRKTFQSIGKLLPKRQNIIISTTMNQGDVEGAFIYDNMFKAIGGATCDDIWIIGGASVYQAGMQFAERILLTLVPDSLNDPNVEYVNFPWINPLEFKLEEVKEMEEDKSLKVLEYLRIV